MLKRNITLIVSGLAGILLVLSGIIYYKSFNIFTKPEASDPTFKGIQYFSGLPPEEYGRGMGFFTINTPEELKLRVPREYIHYRPHQPNGQVDSLLLNFFLPKMKSKRIMERIFSKAMNQENVASILNLFSIFVSLSPKSTYIKCWDNQCLGPEFALFQSALSRFPPHKKGANTVQSLSNGQYHASLNLVAYRSSEMSDVKDADVDTIYLKPDADPHNPTAWIYCRGYACHLYWFRNGLYIEVHFDRALLAHHAEIRKAIDEKIDGFIQSAT